MLAAFAEYAGARGQGIAQAARAMVGGRPCKREREEAGEISWVRRGMKAGRGEEGGKVKLWKEEAAP